MASAMQSAPLASMRAVQRFLSFETAKTMMPTSSSATMTPQVAADTSANSENMIGKPLSLVRNSPAAKKAAFLSQDCGFDF